MPPRSTSTQPRKKPRQQRSRALVDAILTATARVVSSTSPEEMTTNEVARVAGVSIGSLYQYFPSKEALLAALLERELEADVAMCLEQLEACAGLSLEEALERLADALLAHTAERAALHATLLPRIQELERTALVAAARERMWEAFEVFASQRAADLPAGWRDPEPRALQMKMTVAALEAGFNVAKVNAPGALMDGEVRAWMLRVVRAGLEIGVSKAP